MNYPWHYQIVPMSEQQAQEICSWSYPSPYEVYNWRPWELLLAGQEELADPELRNTQYRAVVDDTGTLIGFAQLFPIVGVTRLGLGMRPDLCGLGLGPAFVSFIAYEALRLQPNNEIDLEVLTWNKRAIRCYEQAGFIITDQYERPTPSGLAQFYCMVWQPARTMNNP